MRSCITPLLILASLTSAFADDKSEVSRLAHPTDTVRRVTIVKDYAIVHVTYKQEGGGQIVARKVNGRWISLGGGGGAMGPHEFYQYGIPPQYWSQLGGFKYPQADIDAALNSGPGWPETNQRVLGEDDIGYRSAYELTMMRNEIFARHGMRFKDPLIASYFATRRWYHPSSSFNPNSLTPLEQKNAAFIQSLQNRKGRNL